MAERSGAGSNPWPFSVYDVFGYLAPGFVVILGIDYVFGMHWVLNATLGVSAAALWLGAAYIIGHLVANVSSWLYEEKVVRHVLGASEALLMGDKESRWQRVFPGYYRGLPSATVKTIRDKASTSASDSRALFLAAFSAVKGNEPTLGRLNTFVSLYGFARNTSLAAFVGAGLIGIGAFWVRPGGAFFWFGAALVAGIGLFYRYLKYYRQYTYEVFVSYAGMKEATA